VTWGVAVAGTLHRDDITTPQGQVESLGGSAVYFALAAARFAPVHLNGIVGRDCAPGVNALFSGVHVGLDGLVFSDSPTFVWHAEHDFERWVTRSERYEPGCDSEWQPRLATSSARAEVLFLASMDPQLQLTVLEQSSALLRGMDTMTLFTESARDAVSAVAARSTLAFLNHAELRSLTGASDWVEAARTLVRAETTSAVVVKRGPLGAAVVTAERVVERPALTVGEVIDPTGAGDALAGGFLGRCAAVERADVDVYSEALDAGLECAAHAISTFGTQGLRAFLARGPARSA
jgi:sugar/nucleoside kinase (ribokinase family)